MSINKILMVDHEKCTGCAYCMLACSMEHEDPVQRSKSQVKVCKLERKAVGAPVGDISTLINPKAVEEIARAK